MSKASDFAEQMRVVKASQRPATPDGSVYVSDEGDLMFYVSRKSAADVPELVRWLIDTFDVPCSAGWTSTAWTVADVPAMQAQLDLLRRKLDLAMQCVTYYSGIGFASPPPGPEEARDILRAIEMTE